MGSLRGRLVVASLLWTAGLLLVMHMASLFLVFLFPRFRGAHSFLAVFVAFGLMGAGLWVARRGLARFALLREELAAVRAGRAARISGSYASEVAPLIGELNGLLEERERAVRRAFAAAGDLAHGLKTPLAVLGQSGDPAVGEQVERMARLVQYHLARVAASGVAAPLPVGECVAGLVRTFGKLFPGIAVSVSVEEGVLVRVEREDLEEILGNLLENACKWGRGRGWGWRLFGIWWGFMGGGFRWGRRGWGDCGWRCGCRGWGDGFGVSDRGGFVCSPLAYEAGMSRHGYG